MNGKCCRFGRRQRGGGGQSERRRWLLSAEMWFPLPLTPTSCLCYFCHNLYIFPPQSSSLFLFFLLVYFLLSAFVLFFLPLSPFVSCVVKSGFRFIIHDISAITDWILTQLWGKPVSVGSLMENCLFVYMSACPLSRDTFKLILRFVSWLAQIKCGVF